MASTATDLELEKSCVRIRGPLPDQAGNTQHPTSSTVNRMGYGDPEALQIIREASRNKMFDLREQPGVRIGVVISDDRTMVYAPVSLRHHCGHCRRDHIREIAPCISPHWKRD